MIKSELTIVNNRLIGAVKVKGEPEQTIEEAFILTSHLLKHILDRCIVEEAHELVLKSLLENIEKNTLAMMRDESRGEVKEDKVISDLNKFLREFL